MMTLWRGLRAYPVEPLAICPGNGPMVELLRDANVPFLVDLFFQPSWKKPLKTYFNERRWLRYFNDNAIALVHANDPYPARSVIHAADSLKIPLLCHVRFPFSEEYSKWVFKGLPKPAGFIFNSNYLKEKVGPMLKETSPQSRQWVVYNGVDIGKFSPVYDTGNEIPRIGIIANLHPVKGHEDFFLMTKKLLEQKHDIVCDIIGDDIYGQSRMDFLKKMVEELGISDKVVFHGFVKDVEALVQKLDIVVCSSHDETFGRCIIEAMASGKPVVTTRVGGIPEIVVDKETGFLSPPKSPNELADAVELLLNKRDLCKEMGRRGRVRAETLFSMDAHAKVITNIYQEIYNSM